MVGKEPERESPLQMTAMIDIVFLLLVFFILTFRIVEPEGDFLVHMPLKIIDSVDSSEMELPFRLRIAADEAGNPTTMRLNQLPEAEDFSTLRNQVITALEDHAGPKQYSSNNTIEIDADYELRYGYTIDAITAVSGYHTESGAVELLNNIKLEQRPPK